MEIAEDKTKKRRALVGLALVLIGCQIAFLSPLRQLFASQEFRFHLGMALIILGACLYRNRLVGGILIGIALTFEGLFLMSRL